MNNKVIHLKEVLIADNDYFFLRFLEEYFRDRGFSVDLATDGKEAIQKLLQKDYDIAIIDLFMPKINGREVINFINKKKKRKLLHFEDIEYSKLDYDNKIVAKIQLPLIILTSSSLIEQFDILKDIGADYYIPKGPSAEMKDEFDLILNSLKDMSSKSILRSKGMTIFPREASTDLLEEIYFYSDLFESLSIGIIVLDSDSSIIRVNKMAETLLQKNREDLLGRHIAQVFSKECLVRLKSSLVEALVSERPPEPLRCFEYESHQISVSKLGEKDEMKGWALVIIPGRE